MRLTRHIRLLLIAGVGTGLAAFSASTASAVVTIGSDFSNSPTSGFAATDATFVQVVQGSRSFVSPIDGVVVRWRVLNPLGASQRPRVLRSADGGLTFTGAGTGPVASSPAGGAVPFPLEPGLPIRAGDYFAADQLTAFGLSFSNAVPPSTIVANWAPALADGVTPMAPPGSSNHEMLVNADVEVDGDLDRYGDETQDACPNQGGLHAAPCSAFTLSSVTALAKGVAVVEVSLPGAGTVSAGASTDKSLPAAAAKKKKRRKKGPPLKRADVTRTDKRAGAVTLTLNPSKRARKKLARKGHLRVTIKVAFTPAGGAPASSRSTLLELRP